MRNIVLLLIVFLIGLAAWFLLRDDGMVEQVTEARIEQALLANQVPAPMATCMASRLVDRLNLNQLRKLERVAPQEGESPLPLSTAEALERLRRVDDPEAIETVAKTAASCGFDLMLQRL